MNKEQLKELVEYVLKEMNLHSKEAVQMILGVIAAESNGAIYIKQVGSGIAQGISQIEPATHNDIVNNFLSKRDSLKERLLNVSGAKECNHKYLWFNMAYAIGMTRIFFLRFTEPIPTTLDGQAAYWKKYYNTYLGKGTEAGYIEKYKKYVL